MIYAKPEARILKETQVLKGIIRGNIIELEQHPDLPEGQPVLVRLTAEPSEAAMESLRRSFGSWADVDPVEFDAFLQEIRRSRKASRPPIEP